MLQTCCMSSVINSQGLHSINICYRILFLLNLHFCSNLYLLYWLEELLSCEFSSATSPEPPPSWKGEGRGGVLFNWFPFNFFAPLTVPRCQIDVCFITVLAHTHIHTATCECAYVCTYVYYTVLHICLCYFCCKFNLPFSAGVCLSAECQRNQR